MMFGPNSRGGQGFTRSHLNLNVGTAAAPAAAQPKPWMNYTPKSPTLGEQISRLQSSARDRRQRADQLERDAQRLRREADEDERAIENLRTAR